LVLILLPRSANALALVLVYFGLRPKLNNKHFTTHQFQKYCFILLNQLLDFRPSIISKRDSSVATLRQKILKSKINTIGDDLVILVGFFVVLGYFKFETAGKIVRVFRVPELMIKNPS